MDVEQKPIDHAELRVFFDAKIPMCGCGNPEEGVKLIRDVLRLHPLYEHRDVIGTLLPSTGLEMVVLGLLSEADLNEHGGSIGGSWLTPLGKRVLAALDREIEAHPDDEYEFETFTESHCVHGYPIEDREHSCVGAPETALPCEEDWTS